MTQPNPRYTPDNATPIEYPDVNAVAYLYQNRNGQPTAMFYSGKRSKPDFCYRFQTEAQRQQTIDAQVSRLRAAKVEKQRRHTERTSFKHSVKVGDIFYYSWGYEQTNIDFFQAIATTDKTVTFQEIASELTSDGALSMSGNVIACPNKFTGKPITKLAQQYSGRVMFAMDHGSLTAWDGRALGCSWYA